MPEMPPFAARMVCKAGYVDTIGIRVCARLDHWSPGLLFVSLALVSLVQKSVDIQVHGPLN